MATAWSHAPISALLTVEAAPDTTRALVWPDESGTVRGDMLVPLFPAAARVSQRDPRLHELLAAVDALRLGSPAVRRVVSEHLAERILWGADSTT